MLPITLKLRGFTGIRDGLGRDEITLSFGDDGALIAIVGENGCGKTTILDNLHPYRIMPSRASSYSEASFSLADETWSTDPKKDLVWMHNGHYYWSEILLDKSKKQPKQTAYLYTCPHFEKDATKWLPYTDGDLYSDGKTGTYDQCVHSILGTPQLFFTTAFASQGRKMISAYDNADIKRLMSELLGHDKILDLYSDTMGVLRGLRPALRGLEQKTAERQDLIDVLKDEQQKVTHLELVMDEAREEYVGLMGEWRNTEKAVVALRQQKERFDEQSTRRRELADRLNTLYAEKSKAVSEKKQVQRNEGTEIADRFHTSSRELEDLHARHAKRELRIGELRRLINKNPYDTGELETLKRKAAAIPDLEAQLQACEEQNNERHEALVTKLNKKRALDAAEAEHQQMVNLAEKLAATAKLAKSVPCVGTEYNAQCELLSESNRADEQHQKAVEVIARLDGKMAAAQAALNAVKVGEDPAPRIQAIQHDLGEARAAQGRIAELERAILVVTNADQEITGIEEELASGEEQALAVTRRVEQAKAEREKLEDKQREELAEVVAYWDRMTAEVEDQIDAIVLPALGELDSAEGAVKRALRKAENAEAMVSAYREEIARARAEATFTKQKIDGLEAVTFRAKRLGVLVAQWELLAKALGPDGIIALSIDDAGPAIAAKANDLLLGCYGPRYTLSIETQRETKGGDMREDFVIRVWDAETNESKSLEKMSGGQKVYVNQALAGAMGLYQAEAHNISIHTLFSDESDGALDAEKKVEFVKMKRTVLELGGYKREIFITHTPELLDLVDRVIELEDYKQATDLAAAG